MKTGRAIGNILSQNGVNRPVVHVRKVGGAVAVANEQSLLNDVKGADLPRPLRSPGRPRVQDAADEIVASVLATAGPRVGTRDYSTRRIAMLTGLSQPIVSRSVNRILGFGGEGSLASPQSNTLTLRLSEFRVEYPYVTVTFEKIDAGERSEPQAFKRRAASVMAALRVSGVRDWPQRAGEFRMNDDVLAGDRVRVVWEPGGQPWASFMGHLAASLEACAPVSDSIPGDLLTELAQRAGRGLHGVTWQRQEDGLGAAGVTENSPDFDSKGMTVPEYPSPINGSARASQWLPNIELSITEQIAIALRKEIMNMGFRPGDRITSGSLAARMGIATSSVRAAMRRMSDDGLLSYRQGSFTIPQVDGRDVVDLYAARLQVGTVLLRECAALPRHSLLAPRLALQGLEAAAREGTSNDVDEADIHFQQELADSSGLTQSARSFHALTLRLRTFISILQLDYTPAVDRIVMDDRTIFASLLAGRGDDAVRVWRSKVDNAVQHMSRKSPTSFDRDLWLRLSGGV